MNYVYKPTALELWVSNVLRRLRIYSPEDICEKSISYSLNIHLTYKQNRCYAYEQGNFKLININPFIHKYEQRERFYHELCHILRHAGYQLNMPLSFKELQEWDCNNFTRYAAIPFHMLNEFNLRNDYVISELSHAFKVTESLCHERLEQIHRRITVK